MLYTHDIVICDLIELHRILFDLLCRSEIHKKRLHDDLGKLVTGIRYHTVCYDASVARHADIAGARAHIDKGYI